MTYKEARARLMIFHGIDNPSGEQIIKFALYGEV